MRSCFLLVCLIFLSELALIAQANKPAWSVNPASFQYNMEVTARIKISGVTVTSGGMLGAFIGGECHGVKDLGATGPGGYVFIIFIYSNSASGETVSFKFYDSASDKIYDITETVSFVTDTQVGNAINPQILNCIIEGNSILSVAPDSRDVAYTGGATTFDVSNSGSGSMGWTASVTSGSSWAHITAGSSGTNAGTISVTVDANPDNAQRTASITVTASGAMGSPIDVTVTQKVKALDIKVYLEGTYNIISCAMNPTLNTNPQIIPLTQPYNVAPWNYGGLETVSSIPDGVVDWVLVELRNAATPANAIPSTMLAGWPKAFFLKYNGAIVDIDGTSLPYIGDPIVYGNLYVIIHHRNHLSIMSASGATLIGGIYSFDFTTGLAQAYGGGNGYKQVGITFAMVSGDIDGDGNIFVSDYNTWAAEFGSTLGYYSPDLDMDGNIFVSDYNKWAANFGSTIDSRIKLSLMKLKYFSSVPK